MANAFNEAARRRPEELVVTWIESPGGPIRLRVVGRHLARRLAAPLGHLVGREQQPALRLDVWDGTVAGVPCPLEWDASAFPRDVNGTPVRVDPADWQRIWTAGEGSVTELDVAAGHMVAWRADGSRLSIEERGRPFPVAFQTWLQSRGVVTLHAAAVAREGRAALIVGDSGSGKSTAALACVGAGLAFLGDDQVAVSRTNGRPVAHSLFASVRVDGIVERLRPVVAHDVHRPANGNGKVLVLLSKPGAAVVRSASIAAIIVATVCPGKASTLERASAREALQAVVPSTMLGVLTDRPAVLQGCVHAVLGSATYRLRSGRDLDAVPPLVSQALADAG